MPELPDLVYIEKILKLSLIGSKIERVEVKQPIVIRVMLRQGFEEALSSEQIKAVERHGPFLKISINSLQMIIHFMLSGRFQLQGSAAKQIGNTCFTLYLDNGLALHYGDNKKMGRVYLIEENRYIRRVGVLGYDAFFCPQCQPPAREQFINWK
ncbi:Formamidopyrimidine-DNA glycosylase [subsurface metagenome]